MDASTNIRILIIGGGAIADSTHIPAAKALAGADHVFLAELNPAQREKLAEKHGLVHTVSDYHEALPECDVCIICTPPHVRNAILKDCIAAGKHVLCEKPLSPSSSETKAILAAASENDNRYVPYLSFLSLEERGSPVNPKRLFR